MNILKQHGAPTPNTYASVGDLYIDLDSNIIYKLTQVDNPGVDLGFVNVYKHTDTMYIWEVESMGTGGADLVLKYRKEGGNYAVEIISGNYEAVVDKFCKGDIPDIRLFMDNIRVGYDEFHGEMYTSYEYHLETIDYIRYEPHYWFQADIEIFFDGVSSLIRVHADGSAEYSFIG